MEKLQYIINQEVAQQKSNFCYMLLGHFGDKLSQEVKNEIRSFAEDHQKEADKYDKNIKQ